MKEREEERDRATSIMVKRERLEASRPVKVG